MSPQNLQTSNQLTLSGETLPALLHPGPEIMLPGWLGKTQHQLHPWASQQAAAASGCQSILGARAVGLFWGKEVAIPWKSGFREHWHKHRNLLAHRGVLVTA